MQKLSKNTIDKLESRGLVLFGKHMLDGNLTIVGKPLNVKGNGIEGFINKPIVEHERFGDAVRIKEEQFETDTSILGIFREINSFRVRVWNWIPGPGPGDFDMEVDTEDDAYQLTINYFFEENEHFQAFNNYHVNGRD